MSSIADNPKPKKGAKRAAAGIEWEHAESSDAAKKKPKKEKDAKPRKPRAKATLNQSIGKLASAFCKSVDTFFPDEKLPRESEELEAIVEWWNQSRFFVAAIMGMLATDMPEQYLRYKDIDDEQPSREDGLHNQKALRFILRNALVARSKVDYWEN